MNLYILQYAHAHGEDYITIASDDEDKAIQKWVDAVIDDYGREEYYDEEEEYGGITCVAVIGLDNNRVGVRVIDLSGNPVEVSINRFRNSNEPKDNSGLAQCFWCGGKTERKQSFTSSYDYCPRCKK